MKKKLTIILLIIAVILMAGIGFFMFTTTMSKPTTLDLFMPRDTKKDSADQYDKVKAKLTLILLKDDKVFGYYGDSIQGGRTVSLKETEELIVNGWKMFSKDSLVVTIKPSEKASYKATIDVLDLMTKNQIDKYSMTDLDKKEKEFLKLEE